MNSEYYNLTSLYVILMSLILGFTVVQTLRLFGTQKKVLLVLSATLSLWLFAVIQVTAIDFFPTSKIGFLIAILGFAMSITLVTLLSPLRKALFKVPQEFLLMPQGLRVFFGAGFLVEASLGIIPTTFGILDGVTHITAAFYALFAAILLRSRWSSRRVIFTSNLFGLVDILIVACGIPLAILGEISIHHNMMYAAFFAAPIFFTLHVVSIYKAIQEVPFEVSTKASEVAASLSHSSGGAIS